MMIKTRITHPLTEEHPNEWIEIGALNIGFSEKWFDTSYAGKSPLVVEACIDWHLLGTDEKPVPKPSECHGMMPPLLPIETGPWIMRAISDTLNDRSQLFLAKKSPSPP